MNRGVERLRQAIERFCNSPEYVSHLVFGRITNDQWKEQQLWHCEHHLSFLHPKQVQGMKNDAVLTTPAH